MQRRLRPCPAAVNGGQMRFVESYRPSDERPKTAHDGKQNLPKVTVPSASVLSSNRWIWSFNRSTHFCGQMQQLDNHHNFVAPHAMRGLANCKLPVRHKTKPRIRYGATGKVDGFWTKGRSRKHCGTIAEHAFKIKYSSVAASPSN